MHACIHTYIHTNIRKRALTREGWRQGLMRKDDLYSHQPLPENVCVEGRKEDAGFECSATDKGMSEAVWGVARQTPALETYVPLCASHVSPAGDLAGQRNCRRCVCVCARALYVCMSYLCMCVCIEQALLVCMLLSLSVCACIEPSLYVCLCTELCLYVCAISECVYIEPSLYTCNSPSAVARTLKQRTHTHASSARTHAPGAHAHTRKPRTHAHSKSARTHTHA